ncbi:hypothetical protein VNI00_010571 [Paramarasmius palmivorus]|uniref:NACHT domain-containing protein n=1 Tax=Paramarasmius palmivorus TaxID=297713 RepID=A0AAW0CGS8_9AGAR
MPIGKGKIKSGIRNGAEIALIILRATYVVAEIYPPLKIIAGTALEIGETVKRFKSNQKEWKAFGDHAQELVACAIRLVSNAHCSDERLRESIDVFRSSVADICTCVKDHQEKSRIQRFFAFSREPEEIVEMRQRLDGAVRMFQLDCMITTEVNVIKILENTSIDSINTLLEQANDKLADRFITNASLEKLPYIKGASWNPNRCCLKGTRKAIIAEIMSWATTPRETADILLLTGVAGSGKSTIAHSIAQHAFDSQILLTSFFLNREDSSLNNPSGLITTLARDLSRQSRSLSRAIASIIEHDPGLCTAHSLTLQFQKLIVEPLKQFPLSIPLVVVIDALDEGYTNDLLRVLRNEIPFIPSPIHFFITTRPTNTIQTPLLSRNLAHIRHYSIDIQSSTNKADVAMYIRHGLQAITTDLAIQRSEEALPPGLDVIPYDDSEPELVQNAALLADKADGLFIWASTVISFLGTLVLPESMLIRILLEEPSSELPLTQKMDHLYLEILNDCNWGDPCFVEGYQLLMGTIMVAKTPLSLGALQAMHPQQAKLLPRVAAHLGSLLVIPSDSITPIHAIHLSFRDFITSHASSPMHINENEHHARIAVVLLRVLNRYFSSADMSVTRKSFRSCSSCDVSEKSPKSGMPEEVWYACRFWVDHLPVKGQHESKDLEAQMNLLFQDHFVAWLEVMVTYDVYRKLDSLWAWMEYHSTVSLHTTGICHALFESRDQLNEMRRHQEAEYCNSDALRVSALPAHNAPEVTVKDGPRYDQKDLGTESRAKQ